MMYNSHKSMVMGLNIHNRLAPNTISQLPISIEKNVGFQGIITHFNPHIFTMMLAFHGTSISNHDLEVVHNMDVVMCVL
jgi:hypothetical protein